MVEIKAQPATWPQVVEIDGSAFLVDADNNIVECLSEPDEGCIECGDVGPWVDEATQFCESCYEWIMGPDDFGDEEDDT